MAQDKIGDELKARLIAKARAGVRVYLLYDEIGCYYLPKAYKRELAEAGVLVLPFRTSRGLRNRRGWALPGTPRTASPPPWPPSRRWFAARAASIPY